MYNNLFRVFKVLEDSKPPWFGTAFLNLLVCMFDLVEMDMYLAILVIELLYLAFTSRIAFQLI